MKTNYLIILVSLLYNVTTAQEKATEKKLYFL